MCGDWEYFAKASKRFGAAYLNIETALNRSHDDGVRLMRRDLSERTLQRVDSIRRTWKADGEFMSLHAHTVARVEADQFAILCKQAYYQRDFEKAKEYRKELERLSRSFPVKLRLLHALMLVPFIGALVALIRRA
jgi:hypothetical protein